MKIKRHASQPSAELDPADELDLWNREDSSDLDRSKSLQHYNISIAARDWTVQTIVDQVRQGNIDLDPAFQRRNAWRDARRSRLIESFILGFPVPQIVLAENPKKKKSFIVIDGKQRLMTIAGLYLAEYRGYWTEPALTGLKIMETLNDISIDDFLSGARFAAERRQLDNADIRTTVITGFKGDDVLYDIFYRINTGSVPLSSQELRQVLNRGAFAKHLLEVTSESNPLWVVLGVTTPDARLRDVELLLRLVAWRTSARSYVGNMKPFLDDTMERLNDTWAVEDVEITHLIAEIFKGVDAAIEIFGEHVGRKWKDGRFERSLNRALFEVQAYYFSFADIRKAARAKKKNLLKEFEDLSADPEFIGSIESTTKSIENYKTRFEKFRGMLNKILDVHAKPLALGHAPRKG